MAKFRVYDVVVSIQDANTRIELSKSEHKIIGRYCDASARSRAILLAKGLVLKAWAPKWWRKMYGLTAKQFAKLSADGQIYALASWHFEVDSCKYQGEIEVSF